MKFYRRAIFIIFCCCTSISFLGFSYSSPEHKTITKQCEILSQEKIKIINNLISSGFIVSQNDRKFLGLKDLAIATIASLDHIAEAIRSCDTIQQHPQLKNVPFLMYFIGEIPKAVHDLYVLLCPVAKIIILDPKEYPYFLDDLSQFKFKALYQALTLQKYKMVLSIDCSIRFPKRLDFNKLISNVLKRNPLDVTLLSSAKHASFPVIHPEMYNCFPAINPFEMQKIEQFQSGLILWIRSKKGQKIMKRFLECTLQRNCIAHFGAKKDCNYAIIYSDNTTFSGCHRFDQSAINLILYEESGNQPQKFQWAHPDFIVERSAKLLP